MNVTRILLRRNIGGSLCEKGTPTNLAAAVTVQSLISRYAIVSAIGRVLAAAC
jgi:hypothetical protein